MLGYARLQKQLFAKYRSNSCIFVKNTAMNDNVEIIFKKFIKPLDYNDRILMIQKILQGFNEKKRKMINSNIEVLKSLRKFKGIAVNKSEVVNKEDWYMQ